MSLTLIVAATLTNGIGQGSRLPWRLPSEMAYFARVTKEAPPEHANATIMGRNTWESIPKSKRPLVGRINVVLTQNGEYDLRPSQGLGSSFTKSSLEAALSDITRDSLSARVHRTFIIGGASVYKESLALQAISPPSPIVDRILLTRILSPAFEDCNVFFPEFRHIPGWIQASHADLETWVGFQVAKGVQEENGVEYEFQMWVRKL